MAAIRDGEPERALEHFENPAHARRVVSAEPASLRWLGMASRPEGRRAVLRVGAGESLDYLELMFRTRHGTLRCHDVYSHAQGQRWSEVGALIPFLRDHPALQAAATQRLLLNLIEAVGDRRFEHALLLWQSLPLEVTRSRTGSVLQLGLAVRSRAPAEIARARRGIARDHADDPSLGFVRLRHYAETGQAPAARTAERRLASWIGEDAALLALTAAAHRLAAPAEAVALARSAVAADPDYAPAHWALAAALTADRQPEAAVATLRALGQRFEVEVDPEAVVERAEFTPLASTAAWRSWRAETPAASR